MQSRSNILFIMKEQKTIQVKDKTFAISIPEDELKLQIKRIADQISHDYAGLQPIFLAVLNGSFIFAADF